MSINEEMFYGLLFALAGFLFSMMLTPVYTHFAYKYKFWKKQKKTTVDGQALPIMTKLHAHKFKHTFPTMAGLVGVISITAVTWAFNLDRGQTWLPLVGFLGGSFVGVIDDAINILVQGVALPGFVGQLSFCSSPQLAWYLVGSLPSSSVGPASSSHLSAISKSVLLA